MAARLARLTEIAAPLILLLSVSGCRAAATPEEIARATLYFAPKVKYIEEPRWAFSMAERKKALQNYRKDGSDTLFEMVIDPEGKVRKCRILKTHIEDDYRRIVKRHGRDLVFRAEPETVLYRAFFFPTRYIHTKEFEKQ